MSKKYCPSNGTEGDGFMEKFCLHCLHDNGDTKCCDILMRSMAFSVKDEQFPSEWTYDDSGKPTCTGWLKWDWGKDDNGNWIEPTPPPTDDPNQLTMPFIFDELNIKQYETTLPQTSTNDLGRNQKLNSDKGTILVTGC